MQYSKFAKKFTRPNGITQLMQDLGEAIQHPHPDLCLLGGGNPAMIPAVQSVFEEQMQQLLSSSSFATTVGLYDSPHGELRFREVLADYLNERYGWSLKIDNIALTNGSQNSFFYLFNLFAGDMPDDSHKQILFPLSPEYVGYADAGLSDNMFRSGTPKIELLPENQFKYRVDFDQLPVTDQTGAICLSRPTNPTGNVVTDNELAKLSKLANQQDVPLIIDNAYGEPFPGVIQTPATLTWNSNTILCMSLSKLGLPGARTGIVIANAEIIDALGSLSGIITLAPNSVGAALLTSLLRSRQIDELCQQVIQPFYAKKLDEALALFAEHFSDLPVRIHKPEGAFFLWLWIDGLQIDTAELYQRLKQRKVYVIPGEEFFIGQDHNWRHTRECIRLNYAQPSRSLERGFKVIAEEIQRALTAS